MLFDVLRKRCSRTFRTSNNDTRPRCGCSCLRKEYVAGRRFARHHIHLVLHNTENESANGDINATKPSSDVSITYWKIHPSTPNRSGLTRRGLNSTG